MTPGSRWKFFLNSILEGNRHGAKNFCLPDEEKGIDTVRTIRYRLK